MYSAESISFLEDRIGFGALEIPVTVSPVHKTGSSGRELPFFHRLASLRNIYATAEESFSSETNFNAHLLQFKKDAVKHVLSSIFDKNKDYLPLFDYSFWLLDRPMLFDDAIGYTLAVSSIEQMMSTNRSNIEERNSKLAVDKLRMELEGVKDAYGNVQMNGLKREQYYAIKKAVEVIFPTGLYIESYPW